MPPQALKAPAFWCTLCGKKFTRKEHLERHIPHRIYSDDTRPSTTHSQTAWTPFLPEPVRTSRTSPANPATKPKVVKKETRARRSAEPQPPASPAQLPLPALPAQDEHNHPGPVMGASLEALISDADAYQPQLDLQQGTGSQSSLIPGLPLTGIPAPGGPFSMNDFDFPNLHYDGFEGYDDPIQSFNPKEASLGSQNDPFLNMSDLSRNSSIDINLEDFNGMTDMSGFTGYDGFTTVDNTHHSLADHHEEGFKHFGQNNGSASAQHRDHMPQQMVPKKLNALPRHLGEFPQSRQNKENAIRSPSQHQDAFHHFGQINDNSTFAPAVHQQVFSHFEPNNDRVMSLPPTPHQDFALVSSYGLLSPAKTTPSPPPSGSYAQLEGDKLAATRSEIQAALNEQWKAHFGNDPRSEELFETVFKFISAQQDLLNKSGIFLRMPAF
ncbi:hypothetical protein N0V85_001653 [Neurospora sp. IMI 360204]|nr:hypothetical protein N0V85_001653 [Neurospora sp. IMI 360204]